MGAQNAQFWMVERLDRHQADIVQNGGYRVGCQYESATLCNQLSADVQAG
jgi:hypothetical protein